MYSMILFMVEMSFMAVTRSGFTQTSAVDSMVKSLASSILPVKVT